MKFLENDLELLIFEASKTKDGRLKLQKRGLNCIEKPLYRQVDLGNYGVLDMLQIKHTRLGAIHSIQIDLFELKKDEINIDTFLQAIRYCAGIKKYIECAGNTTNISFNVHLIGKNVEKKSSFCFLANLLESDRINLYLYEYKASLEYGFYFELQSGFYFDNDNEKCKNNLLEIINNSYSEYFSKYYSSISKYFEGYSLDKERIDYCLRIYSEIDSQKDIYINNLPYFVIKQIAETILITPTEKLEKVSIDFIEQFTNQELPF